MKSKYKAIIRDKVFDFKTPIYVYAYDEIQARDMFEYILEDFEEIISIEKC